KFHHVLKRGTGKENFIDAFAFHYRGVVVRDRAPAAAKHFYVVGARFAQKIDNRCEKLDVAAIVTGDADRAHVFLNRRAHDVADGSMVPEVNYLDAVPDEFQVDGVDRAIVPITNRHGG